MGAPSLIILLILLTHNKCSLFIQAITCQKWAGEPVHASIIAAWVALTTTQLVCALKMGPITSYCRLHADDSMSNHHCIRSLWKCLRTKQDKVVSLDWISEGQQLTRFNRPYQMLGISLLTPTKIHISRTTKLNEAKHQWRLPWNWRCSSQISSYYLR